MFDVEGEEDIEKKLEEVFGYVPELTHGKKIRNVYTNCDVKYLQYRK